MLGDGASMAPSKWVKVAGPLGAATLEMARLGWAWLSATKLSDDEGCTVDVLALSWQAVRKRLTDAVARQLARELAAKAWADASPRLRLELGLVLVWARQTKVGPKERGIA